MQRWYSVILLLCLAASQSVRAAECPQGWGLWQDFLDAHVQFDGRVVDYERGGLSTSEGQAYAMFFALVANDQEHFAAILDWATNNLAGGDLLNNLPAWKWGGENGKWGVLDENSASDADVWMAYSLLLAAKRWQQPQYEQIGLAMLKNIEKLEIARLPGLGYVLLPGRVGFQVQPDSWRLNPSYLPIQIARYFQTVTLHEIWGELARSQFRMIESSPVAGVVPDWILFNPGKGFVLDEQAGQYSSYDAIRVYLWWAMLSKDDPEFGPMRRVLSKFKGYSVGRAIPEKVHSLTGEPKGIAPPGILAAIAAHQKTMYARRAIVPSKFDLNSGYYNYALSLFAHGWLEGRYRFDSNGEAVFLCQKAW